MKSARLSISHTFAGLTPVNKNGKTIFYFVNSDSSVEELLRHNLMFERTLTTDISENLLLNFFTQLILEAEHQHAVYTLQNISVLELDLSNETMPKVYSFNLSKSKAKFLKDEKNKELLKGFQGFTTGIKDEKFSVLPETVEEIINNSLNYSYLNKLVKVYISNENNLKTL
ncbi:MAG: type I-B CRISPR-associated protein Cas8b1/Cst1 [Persephonella sp.]|nr:type I-B CRISPR-associated protein Cas8b1/Cst1 [Persephonella sp.]